MHRRSFLGGILALGAAPAVVRASSLMRIVTPSLVETVVYNNRLLTPSMIVAEALKVLEMQFHRDASFDFDAPEKLNGVIQIRKPIRFVTEMRVA